MAVATTQGDFVIFDLGVVLHHSHFRATCLYNSPIVR
jgi:hypothetical protein